MKTIIINDETSIEVNGIRTKEGGLLIKRIGKMMKKAQTDEDFRMAMNGLIAIVSEDKLNTSSLIASLPLILSEFYDEFIGLLGDLTGMKLEEVEALELDKTVEIAAAIIEETDFVKVKNLLKNFKGLQTKFVK